MRVKVKVGVKVEGEVNLVALRHGQPAVDILH